MSNLTPAITGQKFFCRYSTPMTTGHETDVFRAWPRAGESEGAYWHRRARHILSRTDGDWALLSVDGRRFTGRRNGQAISGEFIPA